MFVYSLHIIIFDVQLEAMLIKSMSVFSEKRSSMPTAEGMHVDVFTVELKTDDVIIGD